MSMTDTKSDDSKLVQRKEIDKIQLRALTGAAITGTLIGAHYYRNRRHLPNALGVSAMVFGLTGIISIFYFRGRQRKYMNMKYL